MEPDSIAAKHLEIRFLKTKFRITGRLLKAR